MNLLTVERESRQTMIRDGKDEDQKRKIERSDTQSSSGVEVRKKMVAALRTQQNIGDQKAREYENRSTPMGGRAPSFSMPNPIFRVRR
jgi:hypothetical protein